MAEKELENEGWTKQTTIGEPRLSEIVELYKSLGYEVRLQSAKLDELNGKCSKCYAFDENMVRTVYVRKKR